MTSFSWDTFEQVARSAGERASEIESNRNLPSDLVDSLIDSGVFRLWIPEEYGGEQADIHAMLDAIETASYHDGSTGWCVMIGGSTALNAGFLPTRFATEIYADPRAVTGGFGMPSGAGLAVDGGISVTGQWAWGSGTNHCSWIGGGVRIVDADGNPAALDDGTRGPFVYFNRSDVELLDTWHVTGMKGSGSTDYTVTDAFVPSGRWVSFAASPAPVVDGALYCFSFLGALGLGVASVTIGLARRAIDELIELGAKQPTGSSRSLAERPSIQSDLAIAEAKMAAAQSFIRSVVDESWATATNTGSVTDEQKRKIRLAANHAAASCAEAVDLCYLAAGGTAVYESSPIQRVFRDVHVATQHGMIAPRIMEPLGRMKFGLPTSTSQF